MLIAPAPSSGKHSHKQYCHHCHMDITVEIVIIRTTIKSHLCLHYLLSYLYPLFARCGRGGIGTKMESFRMIYCKAPSDDGWRKYYRDYTLSKVTLNDVFARNVRPAIILVRRAAGRGAGSSQLLSSSATVTARRGI